MVIAMTKKPNPMKWIIVIGGVVLVTALAYFSMQQTQQRYEVCMTFKAALHCATAAGATKNEAIRSAQEIDCTLLSSGRDENMACLDSPPSSVREAK
jgi:hypothetical protein